MRSQSAKIGKDQLGAYAATREGALLRPVRPSQRKAGEILRCKQITGSPFFSMGVGRLAEPWMLCGAWFDMLDGATHIPTRARAMPIPNANDSLDFARHLAILWSAARAELSKPRVDFEAIAALAKKPYAGPKASSSQLCDTGMRFIRSWACQEEARPIASEASDKPNSMNAPRI